MAELAAGFSPITFAIDRTRRPRMRRRPRIAYSQCSSTPARRYAAVKSRRGGYSLSTPRHGTKFRERPGAFCLRRAGTTKGVRLSFPRMSMRLFAFGLRGKVNSCRADKIRAIVDRSSTASCPAISGRRAPVQRNTPLSIRQQRTSDGCGAALYLMEILIRHFDFCPAWYSVGLDREKQNG